MIPLSIYVHILVTTEAILGRLNCNFFLSLECTKISTSKNSSQRASSKIIMHSGEVGGKKEGGKEGIIHHGVCSKPDEITIQVSCPPQAIWVPPQFPISHLFCSAPVLTNSSYPALAYSAPTGYYIVEQRFVSTIFQRRMAILPALCSVLLLSYSAQNSASRIRIVLFPPPPFSSSTHFISE